MLWATFKELRAYYHHLDNVVILRDNIITARGEGHLEGKAEGGAEGLAEGRLSMAQNLKRLGISTDIISQATGLSAADIEKL